MKTSSMKLASRIAAVALLGASLPVLADKGATPEKVTVCAACHGADGKAPQALYPHLAGQYANYLEQALREYRDGTRKNPIMAGQATALTDADIRQLSAYYAAQPGPLYTPSVHGRQK
jgi:cytochrome c553